MKGRCFMDRSTFSHYGWILITVIVMSILIAFAFPLNEWVETESNRVVDKYVEMAIEEEPEQVLLEDAE